MAPLSSTRGSKLIQRLKAITARHTRNSDTSIDGIKDSAFFNLPAEIRCQILELALVPERGHGEMLLELDDTFRGNKPRQRVKELHVKPERRRKIPGIDRLEAIAEKVELVVASCYGRRDGNAESSRIASQEVNLTGWLRSCRRAYDEGIDILYNSTTFVIFSKDLVGTRGEWPQPSMAARMRNLSVFQYTMLQSPRMYFDPLAISFPNLRRLTITLARPGFHDVNRARWAKDLNYSERQDMYVKEFLLPADEVAKKASSLVEFRLRFSSRSMIFEALCEWTMRNQAGPLRMDTNSRPLLVALEENEIPAIKMERPDFFWREVPGEEAAQSSVGYWVGSWIQDHN